MKDTLLLACIGHLVGDYLLQDDWMANNKKKSSSICAIHCTLWTLSVCLFSGWGWLPFLFLWITHFIQDRTKIISWWMSLKWKDQTEFMRCDELRCGDIYEPSIKPGLGPWSVIVVDNVWHILAIWFCWKVLI